MQVNANVTFQLYDVNVQNSNANRLTFLAQNSWTNLSVSMFQSLQVCSRARPDNLSASAKWTLRFKKYSSCP